MPAQTTPTSSSDAPITELVGSDAVAPVSTTPKYRVLGAFVSGVKVNRKGKVVDVDYPAGSIVAEEDFDGLAETYLDLAVIEPV